MPLPFILGAGAVIAGAAGVGSGIQGINKMKDANERLQFAERRHSNNISKFERLSKSSSEKMDALGHLELEILENFEKFANAIEKIQNRPQFRAYEKAGISIPEYDGEKLQSVSIGAGVILGSIGGAALGTAGGFAASGVTTSAVMAFGKASTGAAISGLKGAALKNATLATLGGGALKTAPFAGGMTLGSAVLSATTLGAGLLVGGLIFKATGTKLSEQADEAYEQMRVAEKTINAACDYLVELEQLSEKYYYSLTTAQKVYDNSSSILFNAVDVLNKFDWNDFDEEEKIATQNAVLLVGLLYKMCQVNLVIKSENENEINSINRKAVKVSMDEAECIVEPFLKEIEDCCEEEVFDNIPNEDGEFETEYGKTLRIVNKKIYWNWKNISGYFKNMSADTHIVELYDCDLYCQYERDEGGLRLNSGDMIILTNCRIYSGEWNNYSFTCEAGSKIVVKDCIFEKPRLFVELLSNSSLVMKRCKFEYAKNFISALKENNVEIEIRESEIICPYSDFVFVSGNNSKTTIKSCSLQLSNSKSETCIRSDMLIMEDCHVYANSKSNEYGSWLRTSENNTVIKNCTLENLSLSMSLGYGRVYRCHFESCINITDGVFELDSTIFNECTKITIHQNVSKVSNCIFNKCYDLWGASIENTNFYDTYFMNIRGYFGGNDCNFENCHFQDILVGEKEYNMYYYPIFNVGKGKTSFLDCTFSDIDVRREYLIKCTGNENKTNLYMKNCEFNDCISRRKDGLFIKDIVEEETYTLSPYATGGFKAYDAHPTGRTFNVAVYDNIYQKNCQSIEELTDDVSFNNTHYSYLIRVINENRIGTAKTLELINWESQLGDVEARLRIE